MKNNRNPAITETLRISLGMLICLGLMIGVPNYFSSRFILKALGIAYITEFTSELCLDAGEKSIAGKVELAGKIVIFFLALPVFTSLLELLNQFI